MRVSIILTTYNNPLYLKKALEGVFNQKRPPDEIIVADDGSGRDTARTVKGFIEKSSIPLFHIWQKDKGFRAAKIRNRAIKASSGEYIILLDSDCVVNRYFLSDHLSLAEKGCFVQGKRVLITKDSSATFTHTHANSVLTLLTMSFMGRISNVHHIPRIPYNLSIKNRNLKGIKSCNMSFFKKDVLSVNGFNEDFVGWGNEDSDLACRFFKYGLKKKVHPFMAICFHLWHPISKTVSDWNKQLLSKTFALTEYFCKNGIFKKS